MTLRLLVADDNAAMQKMVRLAFAGENAVIEVVSSGDAAIGILHEFRPNVVLADISMPGFSGYEVCERIRRDPEFAAIPVILLNGAFDPFNDEMAARVGASGHLTKPFRPSEMISMVERTLESASRAASNFSGDKADGVGVGTEIAAESSTPPSAVYDTGESDVFPDVEFAGNAVASESDDEYDTELGENAGTPESDDEYDTVELDLLPETEPGAQSDFFHVSQRALESYLGPGRILEIFGDEPLDVKAAADSRIPDELIKKLAERVAEKMFPLVEAMVRQALAATPANPVEGQQNLKPRMEIYYENRKDDSPGPIGGDADNGYVGGPML